MIKDADLAIPFSRPLAVADVPENGLDVSISADERERAALALANGLEAVSSLRAELRILREGVGGLRVTGELRADIRRTCVVSLEQFDTTVVEPIDMRFAPQVPAEPAPRAGHWRERRRPDEAKDAKASRHIEDLDEDEPDPLVDGRIDLGAIAAEFLALGLDPYPRKPGATFAETEETARAAASPFAALRDVLKKGRES